MIKFFKTKLNDIVTPKSANELTVKNLNKIKKKAFKSIDKIIKRQARKGINSCVVNKRYISEVVVIEIVKHYQDLGFNVKNNTSNEIYLNWSDSE